MPKIAQRYIPKVMRPMLCVVAVLLFVQCHKADLRVAMTDVNVRSWSDEASVVRINEDTSAMYDIDIVLHINSRFVAEQIELEITMLSPDSLRYTEQVTLRINSLPEGPAAQAMDLRLPYRRDAKLKHIGGYTFNIRPLKPLVGVEAAGVYFEAQ